jgi:hypothetical protein
MQPREEGLWRHLLGVSYTLTVVFTPGTVSTVSGWAATTGWTRR